MPSFLTYSLIVSLQVFIVFLHLFLINDTGPRRPSPIGWAEKTGKTSPVADRLALVLKKMAYTNSDRNSDNTIDCVQGLGHQEKKGAAGKVGRACSDR